MSAQSIRRACVLVLATGLAGCNVERFAIGKLGDALAKSGNAYERDDDVELVRQAIPFGLKLVESLLDEEPEHEGLLLAAARGFTQYAYAYVEQDADRLEDADLARSRAMHLRARKLYHRAREYGLRALEVRHHGFRAALVEDPATALADATKDDVPLLYWTAAAWGLELTHAKDDPMELMGLPSVEALIDRALVLDERWNDGAIHGFLILFEETRPSAGLGAKDWRDRARVHFEHAIELSRGERAAPYVAYAEAVLAKSQDRKGFEATLAKALAIDVEKFPAVRLENEIARARARWLLGRADDLFLE